MEYDPVSISFHVSDRKHDFPLSVPFAVTNYMISISTNHFDTHSWLTNISDLLLYSYTDINLLLYLKMYSGPPILSFYF